MASVESPFKALAASAWLSTPPKRLSSGPLFWNTCRSPSTSTSLLNVHWLHTSYMLLHVTALNYGHYFLWKCLQAHNSSITDCNSRQCKQSSVGGDNNTRGWGREGEGGIFKFVHNWMSAKHRLWNETSWTFMFNLEFTEPLNGLQSWAIQENSESVYLHSRAPLHLQSRGMFWEGVKPCQSKRQPAGPPSGK